MVVNFAFLQIAAAPQQKIITHHMLIECDNLENN